MERTNKGEKTMALYKDGNPVSGLNSIPRLTLAQYNALNVKPEFWVRTDAPESYKKLSADQVSYDSSNTVKDKIDDIDLKKVYHKGDTVYFRADNLMLAGRTGWAGKEFYFGLPLDKPIGSDISGASISFGNSGAIYLVSYNQAVDVTNTSRTDSISGLVANNTMLSWKMAFTNAPLSITDGIVNLMLNKATTITFS